MLGSVDATSAGPGSALIIGMSSRAPLPQPVRAMIRIRCSQSAHTTRRLFGVVGLRSRYPKALVGSRNRCRRVRPGRVNRPARRAVRAPSAARIRRFRARPRCRVCRDSPRPTGRTRQQQPPHPQHHRDDRGGSGVHLGPDDGDREPQRPKGFTGVGAEAEEAGAVFADRAGFQGRPLPAAGQPGRDRRCRPRRRRCRRPGRGTGRTGSGGVAAWCRGGSGRPRRSASYQAPPERVALQGV